MCCLGPKNGPHSSLKGVTHTRYKVANPDKMIALQYFIMEREGTAIPGVTKGRGNH